MNYQNIKTFNLGVDKQVFIPYNIDTIREEKKMKKSYSEESYERNYKAEFAKYDRHEEFLTTMIQNKHLLLVDWDNFWSWYYHSDISAEEALKRC